jgi:hypothetical protein
VGEMSIIGGLSKLLSAFKKTHAGDIITFSDNRFSTGHLYESTGFVQCGMVEPRYFYFKKSEGIRYHRFSFRKDELTKRGWLQEGETEWECMQRMGYDRVWDAGKIKWVLNAFKSVEN